MLIDDAEVAGLPAALIWGWRQGRDDLHVVVDDGRGRPGPRSASAVVATRAAELAAPPTVWRVDGRSITPADGLGADDPDRAPGGADLAALLVVHGIDPVVEDGVVRGDVLGLEVARAVPDGDGGWALQVGVGAHDREARAEMRVGEDTGAALDDVRATVLAHRRPGVGRHPANTLARERWLRTLLVTDPGRAGAASLAAVAPASPRTDLRAPSPAAAVGVDPDGTPVVVVASAGVDVDLVPTAAEIRRREAPGARLRIVVPEGDDHRFTRRLAAALAEPADVRTVPPDWQTWTPPLPPAGSDPAGR